MAASAMDIANDLAGLIYHNLPDVIQVESFGLRGRLKVKFKDGTVVYVDVEVHGR